MKAKRGRPARPPAVKLPAKVLESLPPALRDVTGVDTQALMLHAMDTGHVDQLERLFALRREMKAEFARDEFFKALSGFQKDCPIIMKDSKVDSLTKRGSRIKYNYASLDEIVRQVKDPLERWGFSYVIRTEQTPDEVKAVCIAHHKEGHEESTAFAVPVDHEAYMNDAQKVASALTYSKRYAFCNAFGIMTSDPDDDVRGSGEPEPERESSPPPPQHKDDSPRPSQTPEGRKVLENMKNILDFGVADEVFDAKIVDAGHREWNAGKTLADITAVYAKYKKMYDDAITAKEKAAKTGYTPEQDAEAIGGKK